LDEEKKSVKFWRTLGDREHVRSADAGGDDVEFEKDLETKYKLYHVQNGGAVPALIASGAKNLVKETLKNSQVLVVDGWSEVYVWVGRNSSPEDRPAAEAFAQVRFRKYVFRLLIYNIFFFSRHSRRKRAVPTLSPSPSKSR